MKETKKASMPATRSTSNDRATNAAKVARVLIAAEHHIRRVSKRRAGAAARRAYTEAAGLIHSLARRQRV